MAFRRYEKRRVGDYTARWWNKTYITTPRPEHRLYIVEQVVGFKTVTVDNQGVRPDYTYERAIERELTPQEIIDAEMTANNSAPEARGEQAAELAKAGYSGPVAGGEARVLKKLFAELGMPHLIKHGWIRREVTVNAKLSRWRRRRWLRNNAGVPPATHRVKTIRLQHCYLFKSPVTGVPWDKFIRLTRMYKDDDSGLREAVKAVMDNPEAHKEIETLDAVDILAGFNVNV